jgi:hypothetical protein
MKLMSLIKPVFKVGQTAFSLAGKLADNPVTGTIEAVGRTVLDKTELDDKVVGKALDAIDWTGDKVFEMLDIVDPTGTTKMLNGVFDDCIELVDRHRSEALVIAISVLAARPEIAADELKQVVASELKRMAKEAVNDYSGLHVSGYYRGGDVNQGFTDPYEHSSWDPSWSDIPEEYMVPKMWPKEYEENPGYPSFEKGNPPPEDFVTSPLGRIAIKADSDAPVCKDLWYWSPLEIPFERKSRYGYGVPALVGSSLDFEIAEVLCPHHWLSHNHEVMYIPASLFVEMRGRWIQCGYCGKWSFVP